MTVEHHDETGTHAKYHIQFGNLFAEARNADGVLTDIVITPLTPELACKLRDMFAEYADRFEQMRMI